MTSVPVRSLTVMVSAPPSALNWMFSTPLRSMVMVATSRVNRTRPPLAEMSIFSLMLAPLNNMRVGAGLALDDVAAVAGVPDEGVVAGAEQRGVVAAAAIDEIIALAADDDVVAVAAVERELDLAGLDRRGVDGVVAAEAVDRRACRCASKFAIVTCVRQAR